MIPLWDGSVMDPALLNRVANEYGVTNAKIERLRSLPYNQAVRELAELKRDAKNAYRKLAFTYHPDRNAGDVLAEVIFRALPEVLKTIENLRVEPPAPAPQVVVHFTHPGVQVSHAHTRAPSYASNTAGTTTGTTYNASRVVSMSWR